MEEHPLRVGLVLGAVALYGIALVATRGRVNRWLVRGGLASPLAAWSPTLLALAVAARRWSIGNGAAALVAALVAAGWALLAAIRPDWLAVLVHRGGPAICRFPRRYAARSLAATPWRTRLGWWLPMGAALVLGGAVSFVLVRRQSLFAFGDEARFAAWARAALHDRPLVGVPTTSDLYGRRVFQPGPIETYALAPFVRGLGIDVGTATFAVASNLAAALAAAWAASRVAGRRIATLVLALTIVMFAVTVPGRITAALNVYIVVAPMFACFVLAWAVAAGRTEVLPVAAVATALVVQTHIGFGLPVVFAELAAMATWLWRSRGRVSGRAADDLWLAGAVTLVLWAPPLWDQVHGSGNLGDYLGLRLPHRGADGAADALRASFDPTLLARRTELTIGQVTSPSQWWLVGAAATGVALALCRRRYPAMVPVALAVVAGTAALGYALPPGFQPTYHVYFVRAASCFYLLVGVLAADPVWRRVAARLHSRPFAAAATSVATVSVAWLLYWPVAVPADAHDPMVVTARRLTRELDAALPRRGEYEILARGGIDAFQVAETLAAHLDTGSRAVRLFQDGGGTEPRSGRLIVTQGGSDRALAGPVIASTAARGGDADAVARQLSDWLRGHRPLELDPAIPRVLANYVDGAAPSLCVDRLARHPDRLFELPPPVLAELLAEQGLSRPGTTPEVDRLVQRWRGSRSASVRRYPRAQVPTGALLRGSQNMVLVVSRPSC